MDHFEADLMVASKVVDSNIFRMAIQFAYFLKIKWQNSERNVRSFKRFLFGMSPDVSAFKVRVFTSDIKFWIGVYEY